MVGPCDSNYLSLTTCYFNKLLKRGVEMVVTVLFEEMLNG